MWTSFTIAELTHFDLDVNFLCIFKPRGGKLPAVIKLKCLTSQVSKHVEQSTVVPLQWHGDDEGFQANCVAIIEEWTPKVYAAELFRRNFGFYNVQSQTAVNISISSITVHQNASLELAWISFVKATSAIGAFSLSADDNSCYLVDFMAQPTWFEYAMTPHDSPSVFNAIALSVLAAVAHKTLTTGVGVSSDKPRPVV